MEDATILVIDDDPASVHMLMKYLHTSGFKTTIAPSGERALQQLERAQPDLILLDVLMPGGMDGFETCRRLKTREFFLTAFDRPMTGLRTNRINTMTNFCPKDEQLKNFQNSLRIEFSYFAEDIFLVLFLYVISDR